MEVICNQEYIKLAVSSDLHLLSKSLYDDGKAFSRMYYNSDGKQTKNGEKLIDEMLFEVQQQQLDALILTGDLALNGELVSHKELIEKLKMVKQNGVPVFVLPGNHDIGHPNAKGYRGDDTYEVPSINEVQFKELYYEFGYAQAFSIDSASLSYVVPLSTNIWLFCLDNCARVEEKPLRHGELREETFGWLEENLKKARKYGAYPLVAGHYNLAYHNLIFRESFTMRNHERVAMLLKKYETSLFLSGHMHMQHMEQQNGIMDIATSSPCTYPHQYGILTIEDGNHIIYQTQQIMMSQKMRADYRRFYYNNFIRQVSKELEGADEIPDVVKLEMSVYAARLNMYYFSGDFYEICDEIKNAHGWKLWEQYGENIAFFTYLKSILHDSMRNHNIYVQKG